MVDELVEITNWAKSLEMEDIAFAVAIPLIVGVLRRPIANLGVSAVTGALRSFGLMVDGKIREGILPATSSLVVLIAVYAGVVSLDVPSIYEAPVLSLLKAALVFCIFWLINQTFQMLLEQGIPEKHDNAYMRGTWLKQVVRLVIFVLMIIVVLRIWGIDLGPALTGLGIAGAAVALAAQDLIRNLIAGFNNVGEMRFKEGDWIRTQSGEEGIVEQMFLRSTVLRRFDKGLVHIANAELANGSLTNYSERSMRRIFWKISLTYQTEAQQLDAICDQIRAYIRDSDSFVENSDAHLFVRAFAFEASSISILVDCFVADNTLMAEREARHDLLLAIKHIVEDSGAEFAYPTQTIFTHDAAVPQDT